MPTIHILVKGEVQGVFYRASAKKIADESGIKGWIKNTRDGEVEAMITGNDEQLEKFTSWCRQGPPKALVSSLKMTKQPDQLFQDFRIIRE